MLRPLAWAPHHSTLSAGTPRARPELTPVLSPSCVNPQALHKPCFLASAFPLQPQHDLGLTRPCRGVLTESASFLLHLGTAPRPQATQEEARTSTAQRPQTGGQGPTQAKQGAEPSLRVMVTKGTLKCLPSGPSSIHIYKAFPDH